VFSCDSVCEIFTFFKLIQLKKAVNPINVTLLGIVTSVKFLQKKNDARFIRVTPSSIVTFSKVELRLKAPRFIEVGPKLSPSLTVVSPVGIAILSLALRHSSPPSLPVAVIHLGIIAGGLVVTDVVCGLVVTDVVRP
jgi:hypothetical protein